MSENRGGRPSKLTPDVRAKIAVLIAAGNTVEVAAQGVGVSRDTFYEWMTRGEKPGRANAPHRKFREAVELAKAEAEASLVARMVGAAQGGSWQAAAWLLERLAPERWAKPSGRMKAPAEEPATPADPFEEVDELAARRVGS